MDFFFFLEDGKRNTSRFLLSMPQHEGRKQGQAKYIYSVYIVSCLNIEAD